MLASGLLGCGARTGLPVADAELEACGDAGASRPCATLCGSGTETCRAGYWRDCTAPRPRPPELEGTLRDFRSSHPDFESGRIGSDRGIVEARLGDDGKPVYAGRPSTPTTSGAAAFDQWFRDVPGVNVATPHTIRLTRVGGTGRFAFEDRSFFPLDGRLFGDEGRTHNFHFTFEVATRFRYQGGERFTFEGDDDVFVFVNGRLALDLGGVHAAERATLDLDDQAPALGLELGAAHPLHFFFAERHTSGSSFRVETTISEIQRCD